jgi:hypothetical protein
MSAWFFTKGSSAETEGKTRLNRRFMRRTARFARLLDGRLTHCIQIVALLPPPINFFSDVMVLTSNYVRPPQAARWAELPKPIPGLI